MGRPRGIVLPEPFFRVCREYLQGKKGVSACAKELKLAPNTFLSWLTEAYDQDYLSLRTTSDNDTTNDLLKYVRSELKRVINAAVAAGQPDNAMFALFAAQRFLESLKKLLVDVGKKVVNIGVVSGTSTGETINSLVSSRIWDDIISKDDVKTERLNVVALNTPPLHGREVFGNAIASVVSLCGFLADKVPQKCEVTPYGLASPLVVDSKQRTENDEINSAALELVDPTRLLSSSRKKSLREQSDGQSQLDIVLAGVGATANSVFTQALKSVDVAAPAGWVGDVAYIPVNTTGKPLQLLRKGSNEEVFIYSLLSANVMQDLVSRDKDVILVARNSRLFRREAAEPDRPDKTQSIKAAIQGGLCNYLITDRNTARQIMGTQHTPY